MIPAMPKSLFRLKGDLLVPDDLTRGGWSDDAQHGSPPSGILARALEVVPTAVPMQVVRLTVDLFRPVPLTPLSISTTLLRDGRRIQAVEASLSAEGIEVGRASGLKIRLGNTPTVGSGNAPDGQFNPLPEDVAELDWADTFGLTKGVVRFHTDAVEIRSVDSSFVNHGRGRSWFRLRYPLVDGEEMTPFQRLATMADLANGNSQALDPRVWLFVNPDITIYAHRLPQGEWLAMDSVSRQTTHGIGMTDTMVYDRQGVVGRILQSQLLDTRAAPPA